MTDKPRPIRKTAFITYRFCKKKFEFLYYGEHYFDYGDTDDSQSDALRRGNLFHNACEKFFEKIKGEVHIKSIPDHFREFLPIITDKRDLMVNDWIDWFSEQEADRYRKLAQVDQSGTWYPIANELEIELEDEINRTGHVDRVDLIPGTKDLCIIEYKTGKSYDMDNKYSFTDMNQEIGFYVRILREANVFPNNRITHWKVYNPTLEKIWYNKISPISLRAVDVTYKEMVNKINKGGTYEKNIGSWCNRCPYVRDCLYNEGEFEL